MVMNVGLFKYDMDAQLTMPHKLDDSFANTRRFGKKRLKTFADQQVAFAKEEAEDNLAVGARAFENAQSMLQRSLNKAVADGRQRHSQPS